MRSVRLLYNFVIPTFPVEVGLWVFAVLHVRRTFDIAGGMFDSKGFFLFGKFRPRLLAFFGINLFLVGVPKHLERVGGCRNVIFLF